MTLYFHNDLLYSLMMTLFSDDDDFFYIMALTLLYDLIKIMFLFRLCNSSDHWDWRNSTLGASVGEKKVVVAGRSVSK